MNIEIGAKLTYYPPPKFVGDNTHYECEVIGTTPSGRYRIQFDTLEGKKTRAATKARLAEQLPLVP